MRIPSGDRSNQKGGNTGCRSHVSLRRGAANHSMRGANPRAAGMLEQMGATVDTGESARGINHSFEVIGRDACDCAMIWPK
jgi:hypothetical protein